VSAQRTTARQGPAGLSGCPPTYALSVVQRMTCVGSENHVFAIGAPFTGSAYFGSPSDCSLLGPPSSPVYQLGAELPPSTFVSGTLDTAP
jgi:hypothetical protein